MRTDVVEEVVTVAGLSLHVARPRRPEDLIDEHAFAEDEFLPYWAELWPSALALADAVVRADGAVGRGGERGSGAATGGCGSGGGRARLARRVLELGCGLGLPSLAAAAAGADVVATDWSPEAVASCAANARRNGLSLRAAVWRWTDDPAPLGPPFGLVLAADVLYERRNTDWVLAALRRVLADGGEAWLADPGRATAEPFLHAAQTEYVIDTLPHSGPPQVAVHRLRRRAH